MAENGREIKDKFAVVLLAGKQYIVSEGDYLSVDKHFGQDKVSPEVLLLVDGDNIKLGAPTVEGAKVELSVVEEKKSPKTRVMRFRSKSNYHRTYGHRQPVSVLKVEKVG